MIGDLTTRTMGRPGVAQIIFLFIIIIIMIIVGEDVYLLGRGKVTMKLNNFEKFKK